MAADSSNRCQRRLRHEQRASLESARKQSRDDEPSFRHEQSPSYQQIRIGNVPEVRQPLVGVRFDADDCHSGIVPRSTVGIPSANVPPRADACSAACDGVKCSQDVTGCGRTWLRRSAVVTARVCAVSFLKRLLDGFRNAADSSLMGRLSRATSPLTIFTISTVLGVLTGLQAYNYVALSPSTSSPSVVLLSLNLTYWWSWALLVPGRAVDGAPLPVRAADLAAGGVSSTSSAWSCSPPLMLRWRRRLAA